jgi:hypothetical protein
MCVLGGFAVSAQYYVHVRELLETNHIQTIYHIFVAILIVFSLNTFVYDWVEQGT